MRRSFVVRASALSLILALPAYVAACAAGATGGEPDPGTFDSSVGGDTGDGDGSTVDSGGGKDTSVGTDTATGTDTAKGDAGDTAVPPTDTSLGDSTGETSCATGCPAGFWDIDGNPLTGTCGCEYSCTKTGSTDPIDPAYKDDNCDGGDGVVEKCVYVATGDGNDTNTGTRKSPMKTITAAIAKAKGLGVDVCISGETYNEFVQMESGVSVYGGFEEKNPDFAFKRSAAATTTINFAGTVVFAPTIDVDTHLEGLSLHAKTPSGIGSSAYGVRFGGGSGTFYVRYDTIVADNGTDGIDGTPGGKGADGPPGGSGGGGTSGGSGGGGGAGAPASACSVAGGKGGDGGYGSGAGGSGADGSTGGGSGGSGGPANDCGVLGSGTRVPGGNGGNSLSVGAPGSPGGAGLSAGPLTSAALYTPANGPDGKPGKAGASGGGGGGGGGGKTTGSLCFGFGKADKGGGGGAGGSGGCGGDAGTGGTGGGGSFAITAAAGTLIVDGCDIKVGRGGKGGNGAAGGGAGAGGAGGPGGAGADDGGPGGNGGNGAGGGVGGPGSGGAGGPSACVASSSSASVTFAVGLGKNSCVNGGGGPGGAGGANDGLTGAAGPTGASGSSLNL